MRGHGLLGLVVLVAACGDDGGGGGGPTAAAERTPGNAASMSTVVAEAETGGGLAALAQMYADLQIIYQDKQVKSLQSQGGALAIERAALTAGCVQTSGNTVTYTDCAEGPTTFNGTATVNGDNVVFDVAIDVEPDAYNGPINQAASQGGAGAPKMTLNEVGVRETGNLTVTATTLDGTVDVVITLDLTIDIPGLGTQQVPQETPIRAVFDLDRDAAGCAIGGTMTVSSGDIAAVAEYGPACGDVTLR